MKITYSSEIKETDSVMPEKIIESILSHRKIQNFDEFLNPPHPSKINISDFGFKKEIAKTFSILEEIKKNNQMIVVYTDYDADGITGGAILWETLHLLGFKVMPYVPHRKLEGYGFSTKGIDAIKKQFDPALIISVDHGITAKDKVTYAKSISIPIIITDHHLKPEQIPTDAKAIFHIPELSGSGVSYFFSKMIFEHFKKDDSQKLLQTYFQTDYLALASIGTVADLVPLIGPSRSIVKHGHDAFSKTKRIGLKHIIQESGIEKKQITTYEIGYIIAPRINAVGRLEHAIDALRLLCTKDNKKAEELSNKIGKHNKDRQDLVESSLKEAKEIVKNKKLENSKIIILQSETWHEGIIGLIASKLSEEFYRPTIIITKADGFYKGSARSIPSFHITNFLRSQKEYLIDVGGHKGAAGFSINTEKLNIFIKNVTIDADKKIKDKDLEKIINADIKIPLSKINSKLVKLLEKLEPFGIGNPQPIFYSIGKILFAKMFGKTNNHLRLTLKNEGSFPMDFLSFYSKTELTSLSREEEIEIIYTLDINRWNGSEKVEGKIIKIN